MSVNEKMTAIADAIRAKTGGTDALTLDGMAAAIPDVYAAGAESAYDFFWDKYQEDGNRTDYNYAFTGAWWDSGLFKPKYPIKPTTALRMFYLNTALPTYLGIVDVDFSECTSMSYAFRESNLTKVGVCDFRKCTELNNTFGYARVLAEIEELLVTEAQDLSTFTFRNALCLEKIKVTGTIGSSVNFEWSPLSEASIRSIVQALSDTVTGKTLKLLETAVAAAFTAEEWEALIATKPNWTFTLI